MFAVLVAAAAAQNPFTLEEFVTQQFAQRGFTGTWISGEFVVFIFLTVIFGGCVIAI